MRRKRTEGREEKEHEERKEELDKEAEDEMECVGLHGAKNEGDGQCQFPTDTPGRSGRKGWKRRGREKKGGNKKLLSRHKKILNFFEGGGGGRAREGIVQGGRKRDGETDRQTDRQRQRQRDRDRVLELENFIIFTRIVV